MIYYCLDNQVGEMERAGIPIIHCQKTPHGNQLCKAFCHVERFRSGHCAKVGHEHICVCTH